MTADKNTRTIVEGVHQNVQAQLEQNCADTLHHEEETQHKVDQIAEQLQKLTTQLNEFRLASEQNVGEVQKQVSEQFQHRLDLHSERIDLISESANKSQKTAEQNAELLQHLLVGVENRG